MFKQHMLRLCVSLLVQHSDPNSGFYIKVVCNLQHVKTHRVDLSLLFMYLLLLILELLFPRTQNVNYRFISAHL